MNNKESRIILEDQQTDYLYKKNKSNLNINFNRIAFIFFVFFLISLIFFIHLTHLGSRKSRTLVNNIVTQPLNNLYRADIIDRNGKYLVKTVSSIDIGISTKKVIDKKN